MQLRRSGSGVPEVKSEAPVDDTRSEEYQMVYLHRGAPEPLSVPPLFTGPAVIVHVGDTT
jgi:hypothetical protein